MSQWETVAVRDVAVVYDGPHATPAKTDDGPWYLSISSLNNGRFDFVQSAHLSEVDLPRWTKRVAPQSGDTLFSYETRLGEAAYWEHDVEAALGRRMGLLRPKAGKVEPRYLSYAYLGPQFQEVIRQKTLHGATVDRIPVGDMPSWPILLPPLDDQRAILRILGSIDRLIQNNRRRVEVLEEMARTIYREWFVHFRYPGHENAVFIDSALGPIPNGWTASRLAEVADARRGLSWDRSSEIELGGTPVVTIPNLKSRLTFTGSTLLADVSASDRSRFSLIPDDILLIGSNGNPDRVGYAVRVPDATVALFASFLMRVRTDTSATSAKLLYHQLSDPSGLIGSLKATAVGATGLRNLRITTLREALIAVPAREIRQRFEDTCGAIHRSADVLDAQLQRLGQLRDLLLPELVTGRIDVSSLDLDALVEASVA